jgi:hypothetical protein
MIKVCNNEVEPITVSSEIIYFDFYMWLVLRFEIYIWLFYINYVVRFF